MAVYYAKSITESPREDEKGKKVKSFHAKGVTKVANNFSGDIVVIESDFIPKENQGVSEDDS